MLPQLLLLGLMVSAASASATSAPTPSPPCSVDPPNQCTWYNASLPLSARRDALLAALTPAEKLQLLAQQGVDRLHVVADGFNEALHGVAWAGRATVFPCPMALGATFDDGLIREIGVAVGKEALAKHWSKNRSNALSFFAPNINIVRKSYYAYSYVPQGKARQGETHGDLSPPASPRTWRQETCGGVAHRKRTAKIPLSLASSEPHT